MRLSERFTQAHQSMASTAQTLELFDVVPHRLEPFGRMPLPFHDLSNDARRFAAAIGPGRIARKFPVRQVGVIHDRTRGLYDIDPLPTIAKRQLGAPDRRFQVALR